MPVTRVPWTMTDVYTNEHYTFAVSPKRESGETNSARSYPAEDVIDGVAVVVEAPSDPTTTVLSGYCLHAPELVDLERWAAKGYRVRFTNDLGGSFTAVITDFTPLRKRKVSHHAYHEWTMNLTLVGS